METAKIIEDLINMIKQNPEYQEKLHGIIVLNTPSGLKSMEFEKFLREEFSKGITPNSNVNVLYQKLVERALPQVRVDKKMNAIENFIINNEEIQKDIELVEYFKTSLYKKMNDEYKVVFAEKEYSLDEYYSLIMKNRLETEKAKNKPIEYAIDSVFEFVEEDLDKVNELGITNRELRENLIQEVKSKMVSSNELEINGEIISIEDYICDQYTIYLELAERNLENPSLVSRIIQTDGIYVSEDSQKLTGKEGYTILSNLKKKEITSNNDVYMKTKDALYKSKDMDTIDSVLSSIMEISTLNEEQVSAINELADKERILVKKYEMNSEEMISAIETRMDELIGLLNNKLSVESRDYIENSIISIERDIANFESVPSDIIDNLNELKFKYQCESCIQRISDREEKITKDFITEFQFQLITVIKPLVFSISGEVNSVNTGLNVQLESLVKDLMNKVANALENNIISQEIYDACIQRIDSVIDMKKDNRISRVI